MTNCKDPIFPTFCEYTFSEIVAMVWLKKIKTQKMKTKKIALTESARSFIENTKKALPHVNCCVDDDNCFFIGKTGMLQRYSQ